MGDYNCQGHGCGRSAWDHPNPRSPVFCESCWSELPEPLREAVASAALWATPGVHSSALSLAVKNARDYLKAWHRDVVASAPPGDA